MTTTATLADDHACTGCGARAASCGIGKWLARRPCCHRCDHPNPNPEGRTRHELRPLRTPRPPPIRREHPSRGAVVRTLRRPAAPPSSPSATPRTERNCTMTDDTNDRDTCDACRGSADGCAARQAAHYGRCCGLCTHGPAAAAAPSSFGVGVRKKPQVLGGIPLRGAASPFFHLRGRRDRG